MPIKFLGRKIETNFLVNSVQWVDSFRIKCSSYQHNNLQFFDISKICVYLFLKFLFSKSSTDGGQCELANAVYNIHGYLDIILKFESCNCYGKKRFFSDIHENFQQNTYILDGRFSSNVPCITIRKFIDKNFLVAKNYLCNFR